MFFVRASTRLGLGLVLIAAACEPEAPPRAADAPPEAGTAPTVASFEPGTTPAVLTFAAERGSFTDSSKVSDVPEGSRGLVRVSLLEGPKPPAGQVWVANLKAPGDAPVELSTVKREMFEELALGQGLSSEVSLPQGLEPPPQVAANTGDVIVYKTAWCGVCKKVQNYLDKKGVKYVSKDIEKDRAAAAELQGKAAKAGIGTGSVPVIDVGGELMVGFDRGRLEKLLAG
ncbi:MAG: glutaredoxin family protein [Nannocystaceae bacterium]|nr:glutaredoxin family protein [Nannocystaceae bacterium]